MLNRPSDDLAGTEDEAPRRPHPKPRQSPHWAFLRWFERRHQETLGSVYSEVGGDLAAAARLVATLGLDETQRRAEAFFKDAYWVDHGGHTVRCFASRVNAYGQTTAPLKPADQKRKEYLLAHRGEAETAAWIQANAAEAARLGVA